LTAYTAFGIICHKPSHVLQ